MAQPAWAPCVKLLSGSARPIRASSVPWYTATTATTATSIFWLTPLPGTTLFDLGGLQVELEALLGVSVDLLTPGDLPIKFRDRVLLEARPV